MNARNFSISAVCLLLLSGTASAGVVTYRGDTTAQPTYHRALEDFSSLSAVGTAVRYETRSFSVSQSGSYAFTSAATFDSFLFLYGPSFNPATPLTNGLIANDDLVSLRSSGFNFDLVAGSNYTAVFTGFSNDSFGAYAVSIGGDGDISAIASDAASPRVLVLSGDTTGRDTYNRPREDLSGLSAVGTAVAYETLGFTVAVSGNYSITSSAEFDSFLTLYDTSFDPGSALTRALVANDDLSGFNASGVSFSLVAGTTYVSVLTGFGNNDFGRFGLQIAGAGSVTAIGPAVPEPATWAMMIAGFGLVGAATRRGRSVRSEIA